MTFLEQDQQHQPPPTEDWKSLSTEQKSRMLCLLVEADQGARIYFSIHTKIRQIIYVQIYLAENLNRAEMCWFASPLLPYLLHL